MSSSSSPPDYAPLRNKDMDSIDGLDMLPLHRLNPKRRRAFGVFKLISALVILAFIVLTFALSFHAVDLLGKIGQLIKASNKPVSHYRSYKYPCGQSAMEAREKGCIFDVMTMAWQSPECHDPDLAEEFAMLGPWEFFADPSGMQPMSLEQVATEGQVTWTTRGYFVQHCAFAYKGLHRAWQRAWRVDSNSASAEHVELCARVLANQSIPLDAISTRIHVDFPSCN